MTNAEWTCPKHGTLCTSKVKKNSETGRFQGIYYSCKKYSECGYYMDLKTGKGMFSKRLGAKEVK